MNNEEKNLTPENEGVETDNGVKTESTGESKLSGGLLAAIIGGVVLVIAIILLIVLLPGSGDNSGDGGNGDGGTGDVGDNSGDKDENTKIAYTVTVVDQNGDPVSGAVIYFYPQGGVDFPMGTKDNGTVSYTTDKQVKFSVYSLPDNYEYDDMSIKQSFGNDGKITVTVTRNEPEITGVSYTVRVVDQNDNPVVGASVQMCSDKGCIPLELTDENGESVKIIDADNFKAQIQSLPEGYTDSTGGEYQEFSGDAENGFTVIIKVTKN